MCFDGILLDKNIFFLPGDKKNKKGKRLQLMVNKLILKLKFHFRRNYIPCIIIVQYYPRGLAVIDGA